MEIFGKEDKKKEAIEKLLNDNECIFVFLNTSNEELVVPQNLKNSSSLTLQLSLLFRGNLFFIDSGIKVDLLFDEDYENCFLPWSSIWGARPETGGDTTIWIDAVPQEIREKFKKNETTSEKIKESENKTNGEVKSQEKRKSLKKQLQKDKKTPIFKIIK